MLDAAADERRRLRFWWRDDDVGIDHPDFPRLLELAARHRVPVALAVVPLRLTQVVQTRIAGSDEATVIQHGFRHRNHAPLGAPQLELGGRDPERVLQELDWGRRILETAFGSHFLTVLAPPWHRLDHRLLPRLRCCGFVGLSTGGHRISPAPFPGLAQVNVHVDPVDWRNSRPGDRRFVGEKAALAQLLAMARADEPIGIMTHHRGLEEAIWMFLDRLFGILSSHPAASVCAAPQLFQEGAIEVPRAPPSLSRS
jgi:peptidoglycan/xylan/chitin deacetylase (PgdA/CDA1 family)